MLVSRTKTSKVPAHMMKRPKFITNNPAPGTNLSGVIDRLRQARPDAVVLVRLVQQEPVVPVENASLEVAPLYPHPRRLAFVLGVFAQHPLTRP